MRLTQLGHQVPRKNSRITVPGSRRLESEKFPSRFAAASEKSGARDPIPSVSVRFCILKSTLRYLGKQNKSGSKQRTSGDTGFSRAGEPDLLIRGTFGGETDRVGSALLNVCAVRKLIARQNGSANYEKQRPG
jgi:hypothetical protein